MKKIYLPILITFSLIVSAGIFAQPANDNCDGAIILGDVSDWCSSVGEYTNTSATPSGYSITTCPGDNNDVWFAFVAGGTDVTITVRGQTTVTPGGSLQNPQVYIYDGSCNASDNLRCESDVAGNNIIELYIGGLTVGQTYYIRVQGINGNTGTFQLCINNYNPPAQPGADCFDASTLCDKSSFVVQSVVGAGTDITEMNDATCFGNGINTNYETNSTWFNWICDQSGTLTFTLSPLNESDDLDFVLYELPNGIDDCSGKVLMRCMASGQHGNVCVYPTCPCLGPTGLNLTDSDISEDAGCGDAGDDSWLSAIDMISGHAYTLVVNNFSATGNGFSIDFGGTGTFLGPQADFITDEPDNKVCIGESVQFIDASSFPAGSITNWEWTFGVDAVPSFAIGEGPHEVYYNSSGLKSVVLTIETDLGCLVTEIATFEVLQEMEFDTIFTEPDCGGIANGGIELAVSNGTSPYQFNWGDGWTSDNFLTGVAEGDYTVTIRDAENCDQELVLPLREPGPALTATDQFIQPSCFGFANGQLIITVDEGTGTSPYMYNFGTGLVPDNIYTGVSAGEYPVYVIDAAGCDEDFIIDVTEPPPLEISAIDTFDVNCFGDMDGSAIVYPVGGVGNYSYLWSDNQTDSIASNLDIGQYSVTVYDGNNCEVTGGVSIIQPPLLSIDTTGTADIVCFGDSTGFISVVAEGGVPEFLYSIDSIIWQPDTILSALPAGYFNAYVMDANGCISTIGVELSQPPELIVYAGEDTLINLGDTVDLSALVMPVGTPVSIMWTPPNTVLHNCWNCFDITVFPYQTTNYLATIIDSTGCQASDNVRISVFINRPVYIPNVFSPNNDGINDNFTLYGNASAKNVKSLKIFNRWGDLVFDGQNFPLNNEKWGWDGKFKGKNLNAAVFVYLAEVEFIDGKIIVYSGDVTLLR